MAGFRWYSLVSGTLAPWRTPVGLVPGACPGLSRPKLALALLPCRCRVLSQAGRGQRLRLAHPPAARGALALRLLLSVRGVDGRLVGRSGSDHQRDDRMACR